MIEVTIYPSYDTLFCGYYEYGFRLLAQKGEISLKFSSCAQAPVTYSPRAKGFRGQFLFVDKDKLQQSVGFVDIADGFNDLRPSLLNEVDVYFKMNFNRDFIKQEFEGCNIILPAPPSFPVRYMNWTTLPKDIVNMYRFTVGFDKNSTSSEDLKRLKVLIKRHLSVLRERLSLQDLLEYRCAPEEKIDLFYTAAAWVEDMELVNRRANLIRQLRQIGEEYKIHAEFVYNPTTYSLYPEITPLGRRSVSEYFDLLAQSKLVVIHKSLAGGALSWRIGESLALGKAFIQEFTPNAYYVPHILHPELGEFHHEADALEKAKYILDNEPVRQAMQQRSKEIFDSYFAPEKAAEYLLTSLLKRSSANQVQ